MKLTRLLLSLLAPLAIALPATAQDGCVGLREAGQRRDGNYIYIYVEVSNDCDRDLASATYSGYLYDSSDSIVNSSTNAVIDVPAGETQTMTFIFFQREAYSGWRVEALYGNFYDSASF